MSNGTDEPMTQQESLPSAKPGGRIRTALTDEQLTILLNVVAEAGYLLAVDDQLRTLDSDLADTLRRILNEPSLPPQVDSSSQRTIEIWNGLWGTWSDAVAEVGDEDGSYVNHEEHWHPPYFDLGALKDALEQAARPLIERIDRVFPLLNEPNLFLESLAEINENMRSYPDWFQPVEDNLTLGPQASLCILRWTWLGLTRQTEPGSKLVDRLCSLRMPGQHAELDPNTCFEFFAGLPEPACRQIHFYLRESQFSEMLAGYRSVWRRIQEEYERRFDPATYLQACEANLEHDWRYGEPLIANALSRQDFAAAERIVELTLSSLLGYPPEKAWCPERQLLPLPRYHPMPEEEEAIKRLLDKWEICATRRGNSQRIASLRLQCILLKSPENWAVVLAAFKAYQQQVIKPAAIEQLFAEWQMRMVAVCQYQQSANESQSDSWIHRLIDAQRYPAIHQKHLMEHMDIWLACCLEHAAFFQKNWRSLALLTRNLPQFHDTQVKCPTFRTQVLFPALHVSKDMETSIKEALAMVADNVNRLEVQPIWDKHLHTLIPNPGGSGSYYRDSALWMKALSEVSAASYHTLLANWKIEFRRRRNLWQDMISVRCPGV